MKRVAPYIVVLVSTLLVAFVLLAMGWYAADSDSPALQPVESNVQGGSDVEASGRGPGARTTTSHPAGSVANTSEERILKPAVNEGGGPATVREDPPVEPAVIEGSLRVTVLDPAGEPVRPLGITVEVKPGPKGKSRWREKFRDRDLAPEGPFDLPIPAEVRGIEGAVMAVHVAVEGYAFERVEVPASVTEVEVRLVEPAYLILEVPNADSYPDTRVFWKLVGELGEFWRADDSPTRKLPDGGGVFISPFKSALVRPGKYTLEIIRTGSVRGGANRWPGGWGDLVLERHELELKPGRNDYSVNYPVLHKLEVTANGAQPGDLRLVSSKGIELPVVERDGEKVFPYVPAGDWVLYDRIGRQRVTVDSDKTVEFLPTDADCLLIRDLPEDCSMYEAGFRGGDLVVAVNGVELTDFRNPHWYRGLDYQTWTVLRNGARQDVSFTYRDVLRTLPDELKPDLTRPWRREGWPEELRIH